MLKTSRIRVQVYAGNNTREARMMLISFKKHQRVFSPNLTVCLRFNPPRWLCRVGDFQSIEEADAMMRKLKATVYSKKVSIVKDQINIPL